MSPFKFAFGYGEHEQKAWRDMLSNNQVMHGETGGVEFPEKWHEQPLTVLALAGLAGWIWFKRKG